MQALVGHAALLERLLRLPEIPRLGVGEAEVVLLYLEYLDQLSFACHHYPGLLIATSVLAVACLAHQALRVSRPISRLPGRRAF